MIKIGGGADSSTPNDVGLKEAIQGNPYRDFNQDLLEIVSRQKRIPRGAPAELTRQCGYKSRANIIRFLRWAEKAEAGSEKQHYKAPSLPKLRNIPSVNVVEILGLGGDEKTTFTLLRATNRSELQRLYDRFVAGKPEPLPTISWSRSNDAAVGPSVDPEYLDTFFKKHIAGPEASAVVVLAAPYSGASHALHALQGRFGKRRRLLHVTPPLEDERVTEAHVLRKIAAAFEIDPETEGSNSLRLPALIIEHTRREKICVVVHNANLIEGQGRRKLLALFEQAMQAGRKNGAPDKEINESSSPELPHVIVHYSSSQIPVPLHTSAFKGHMATYQPDGIGYLATGGSEAADESIRWTVETDLEDMVEYVAEQSERAGRKGLAHMRQGPSRSRVRRQMERMLRAGLQPNRTSLLIRAAAMTDPRLLVPDDPTLGLRRLVATELQDRFPEFSRLRHDVLSSIRGITDEHLRALRMISTSVHWMTRAMMVDLRSESSAGTWVAKYSDWGAVADLIEAPDYALASWYRIDEGEDNSRARAPIAVKSVIQDAWREDHPLSYCDVHLALARNLMRLALLPPDEAKRRFEMEYHYEKPPEGPGAVFAVEAVRYAARAFEVLHGPSAQAALKDRERREQVNLCKSIVRDALRKLGFNLGAEAPWPQRSQHALSRQFGRYQQKLELLHTLSIGNLGERASDLLPHALHEEFGREVGIARFGILDLDGAIDAFMRSASDETLDPRLRIDCMLHGASVAVAAHSFAAAQTLIEKAERVAFLGKPREAPNLKRRISVRRALVARGRGELALGHKIFESVLKAGEHLPINGDQAIACIDLLLDYGQMSPEVYEDALTLAELNSSQLHRDDLFYEAARFDIRSAQVLARKGLPLSGEALLDDIGIQLLANGGSPRLHLEFMLASAEVLLYQDHFEWAYAAYLHPGLQLARERYHMSFEVQFARLSRICLDTMSSRLERQLGEDKEQQCARILSLLRRDFGHSNGKAFAAWPSAVRRNMLRDQYRNFRNAPYDPQHGFDLELPFDTQAEWAGRMADPQFILDERKRVAESLLPNEDTHRYCNLMPTTWRNNCTVCQPQQ